MNTTRKACITTAAVTIQLAGLSSGMAAEARLLWPESCLAKVLRTAEAGPAPLALEVSGARGEIVSAQAVFRVPTDLPAATLSISDLVGASSDARIPASGVKLQWVRYIDLTRNSQGVPADELVAAAPVSLPDPYWEDAAITVKANQAQPIWLEFHVPFDAPAGAYTGELQVKGGVAPAVLQVRLQVWDFELPRERHLSMINWWRFPGPGFDDRVKPYSDEYWKLLADFCAFLVEHRQTDINTSIGLIDETGDDQKGWTQDTGKLERYADTAFKAGIRQIHLHSVGRLTAEILDPASRVAAIEPNFRRLAALEQLIQRRGWSRRFVVSISDEPFVHHEETYAGLVDRVHHTAPSVRCAEAVETEYLGKLDIWIPKYSHLNLWYSKFDEARRQGAELWFYICCHPMGRYPNRWVDQPLLHVRVLHWLNYLYDLRGFLHWALNHFAEGDPYSEKAIGSPYSPGERAIAYPGRTGLVGSLRFSAQRDGLQDYEYLWVLEDRLRQIKQQVGEKEAFWLDPRQRPLELCRRVIGSFHDYTRNPDVLLEARKAVAEEIEALGTGPLLVVQTSPPEGTVVPAGPRHIGIRGLVSPGAKVTVDGRPVPTVRPSGYFAMPFFMPDGRPTLTVEVEHHGLKRAVTRTFKLTD
ncbi:MAG TPA: DUF4091 domain-containing protein [Phycisphaerae bacterium]|nr:DUF4091 domain-containing protein [Phycisphaerae bacterium]HRY69128.1 DUF4091 domain-containing protein [Phycisphaerae bacterium]HSA26089.1 DUF4091 domain-containing protein [Phycisphaerae bacterium]